MVEVARQPRRRLSDLLEDAEFLLVQLVVVSGGSHHSARQQQRIADLHGRLDIIDRRLRLRAAKLGEESGVTFGELRRRLRRRAERPYRGPDRRAIPVSVRAPGRGQARHPTG